MEINEKSLVSARRVLKGALLLCVLAAFWDASCERTDPGTIVPPPPTVAITLSPTAIAFNDTAGTPNATAQAVSVTGNGNASLNGLSVGTMTYGAGTAGWLTATLSGADAPATLTLTPANRGIAPGTYTATIPVASSVASNSPQTVTVTFTVSAPPSFGWIRRVAWSSSAPASRATARRRHRPSPSRTRSASIAVAATDS